MNALFERHKEDCEKHTIELLKGEVQKLWDRCVVHIQQAMEIRRYRDPRENDPDYGRRLRELEGQIEAIDREQQGFRMTGNYHESPEKKSSWKDWVLMIVSLLIVGYLARLDMKLDDLAEMKAQEKILEKRADQTDKHLESTDGQVEQLRNHVYRGSP